MGAQPLNIPKVGVECMQVKSVDDLFQKLQEYKADSFRDYYKEFVFIKPKDFKRFKAHFQSSRNVMNSHVNYRSKHAIRHIHAREADGMVDVHIDHGNTDRSVLLGVIHFICDIIR